MGLFNKKKEPQQQVFLVKRCPECFVNLPINAKRCFSCNARVGKVDRFGKARKPIDWLSYLVCLVSWLLFAYFVWKYLV